MKGIILTLLLVFSTTGLSEEVESVLGKVKMGQSKMTQPDGISRELLTVEASIFYDYYEEDEEGKETNTYISAKRLVDSEEVIIILREDDRKELLGHIQTYKRWNKIAKEKGLIAEKEIGKLETKAVFWQSNLKLDLLVEAEPQLKVLFYRVTDESFFVIIFPKLVDALFNNPDKQIGFLSLNLESVKALEKIISNENVKKKAEEQLKKQRKIAEKQRKKEEEQKKRTEELRRGSELLK